MERITFVLELVPGSPVDFGSYGVSLNYEMYSAVVRIARNPVVAPENFDDFIYETPISGEFDARQIDPVNAELRFHHRIHGQGPIVFREDSGVYVLLLEHPMRRAPAVAIDFRRPDLSVDQIPFGHKQEPAHKVQFWICDAGGRNKTDDLRPQIRQITLIADS